MQQPHEVRPFDVVEQYADDVIKGVQPACLLVISACQRYLDDKDRAHEKGWTLDIEAGEFAIDFIQNFVRHTSSVFAGKPVLLEPWQQFILFNLFAWKKKDGRRRFTKTYIEIPKKNGKSLLASAVSLYMLIADGEQNAEIYFAATKRDQADIVFEEAKRMVKFQPEFKAIIQLQRSAIVFEGTNSSAKPLSSEKNSMDGKRPFFVVIDEYHQHQNSEISDELKSAMAARPSPLHFTITTAGFNDGPCLLLHRTCREILEGKKDDDSMFTIIYTIDEDDNWQLPSTWRKANPNFGVSFEADVLKEACQEAKNMGGQKMVEFMTKRLNIWMKTGKIWIPDSKWMECQEDFGLELFQGKQVWMGMDLAAYHDITALVMVTEIEGDLYVYGQYWLPEEIFEEKLEEDDKHIYRTFVDAGYLHLTEGNVTDYSIIRKLLSGWHIDEGEVQYDEGALMESMDIQCIGYDQWQAFQIGAELTGDGIEMDKVPQTTGRLNPATTEVEKRVRQGTLKHNGDPVLRWMMGNVELFYDSTGCVKPNKKTSKGKIDGVVAMVMGIHEYLIDVTEDKPDPNQGFVFIPH
ncbi:MAG: terminase large subunit [Flavobacteriales bacterium]|nr:terminase large subunit [Flavobacteriales bacterium]